ncbi:MAG: c-type cytochrome [Polyangiaceae bacterium]
MKNFLMFSVGCAALAAFVPACSSTDAPSGGGAGAPSGGAGAPGGGAGAPSGGGSGLAVNTFTGPGDAVNGATVYARAASADAASCSSCHGADAAGSLGPNITPSTTAGIGGWTEEQFFQLVRNRKSRAGTTVCMEMSPSADGKPFTTALVSDKEIADLYAFLMAKPPNDTVQKGAYLALDPACSTP